MRIKMKKLKKSYSGFSLGLLALFVFSCTLMGSNKQATACATCSAYESALRTQFNTHQNWMTNSWWNGNVEPAMQRLADELRRAVLFETATFGAFLDGQNLMGAQRAIQESTANTLKNYAPSNQICKFGTLSRSLALSESKGNTNQLVLSKRSLNRQMGHAQMASSPGLQQDRTARLEQFKKDYCDEQDFGTAMKPMCTGSPTDDRLNIDINYTRAVDTKNTLDVDLSDATLTNDERDIIALANNLYAHKVFERINSEDLKQTNKFSGFF